MTACLLTVLLVFLLPLRLPVAFQATISASYVAGFNNRTAAIASASVGIMTLLWSWHRTRITQNSRSTRVHSDQKPIGFVLLGTVIAASGAFFLVAELLVTHSHLRYLADAGYFMEQMSSHVEYGRPLYTQVEFAYGPLLFYPTVWLHRWLHCSWPTAYFTTLGLDQGIGLALLTYILNELPLRTIDRRFAVIVLAIGALNPLLGLNYTFFRFVTPYAVLLFATRRSSMWQVATLLAAGEVLALGISPEIGFALFLGAVAFSFLNALRWDGRWMLVAIAPAMGIAAFISIARQPYLRMLHSFSRGALNLPVAPYPHILVFLVALVWIVPVMIGTYLGSKTTIGIRMAACYAIGIGLVPPALGRCDPLHVFFNGAGILVLSLVAIRSFPMAARLGWMASLLLLIGWEQWVNNTLYLERTADTFRLALVPRLSAPLRDRLLLVVDRYNSDLADHVRPVAQDRDYQLDVSGLEQEVGHASVATPWEVSPSVEEELRRTGHYLPDYFCFFVDVLNDVNEQMKIHNLNEANWALLPVEREDVFLETPQNIDGVQGFLFPYRDRHPLPYRLGEAFNQNIDDNWVEIKRFGPYLLYSHRRTSVLIP